MPLPFNTSKYDDYENPAPIIKVGGLSAQDATDPYAVYQKQALEANDAKWKAKTEALKAARMDTPGKMERIADALLAFGAPTHGNNWAALSNASKALSLSGKEVEDAQRERTNQLAQLRAQQEDAAAAIREKYGFAGAQAQQAMNLKRLDTSKPPALAAPVYDPFHRRVDQAGNLIQPGYAIDNKGNLIKLDRTSPEVKNGFAQKYPQNQNGPMPAKGNAPEDSSESKVKNYTSMPDLINAPVGSFGMLNGTSYRIDEGGPVKLDIAPTVSIPAKIQEAIDKGLTGEDLLNVVKSVDGAMANQARGVLEGLLPYPTGARSNPRSQAIAQIAAAADPRLDATDYNVR